MALYCNYQSEIQGRHWKPLTSRPFPFPRQIFLTKTIMEDTHPIISVTMNSRLSEQPKGKPSLPFKAEKTHQNFPIESVTDNRLKVILKRKLSELKVALQSS